MVKPVTGMVYFYYLFFTPSFFFLSTKKLQGDDAVSQLVWCLEECPKASEA